MGKWSQGEKSIEGRAPPRKLLLQGRKWEVRKVRLQR